MVWDKKPEPMNEQDWEKVGRMKRLQIYLPPTKEGLHVLAHRLDGFILQLKGLTQIPGPTSITMLAAESLIKQTNLVLQALSVEQDTELREAEGRKTVTHPKLVFNERQEKKQG